MKQEITTQNKKLMDKLYEFILTKLFGLSLPPLGAISSIFALINFEEGKWIYGIMGVLGFIIIALTASYVKLKLGKQELTVTADKNNEETSVQLAKLMQETMEKIIVSTNAENIRREKFWTDRIDILAVRLREECEKEKVFWAEREEKVREEKHNLVNKYTPIVGNHKLLIIQLNERGIQVTEDYKLVFPENMLKRREGDS